MVIGSGVVSAAIKSFRYSSTLCGLGTGAVHVISQLCSVCCFNVHGVAFESISPFRKEKKKWSPRPKFEPKKSKKKYFRPNGLFAGSAIRGCAQYNNGSVCHNIGQLASWAIVQKAGQCYAAQISVQFREGNVQREGNLTAENWCTVQEY